MTKVLQRTNEMTITPDGLIRIDGFSAFRKIVRGGIIYVQFCDRDRMRSQCRGTKFIEVPLALLVEILSTPNEDGQSNPTTE